MLGRLILLLLQIVIGWLGSQAVMGYIKIGAPFHLFIFAIVAAIIVFLVGIIAAQVLREVGSPSTHTLSWAVALALIAAALWTWGPTYIPQIPWGKVRPNEYAVLAGAILGYLIKR